MYSFPLLLSVYLTVGVPLKADCTEIKEESQLGVTTSSLLQKKTPFVSSIQTFLLLICARSAGEPP